MPEKPRWHRLRVEALYSVKDCHCLLQSSSKCIDEMFLILLSTLLCQTHLMETTLIRVINNSQARQLALTAVQSQPQRSVTLRNERKPLADFNEFI